MILIICNIWKFKPVFAINLYPIVPEEIKYISHYNYLQNPFGMISGNQHGSGDGSFEVGVSGMYRELNRVLSTNKWGAGYEAEVWGQTKHWGGFSLGGAFTIANLLTDSLLTPSNRQNQLTPELTNRLATPSQAYVNYQFRNLLDISAGYIALNTPWMLSTLYTPYMLTSTFQGVIVNVQPLKSLLLTGFRTMGFQLGAENWWTNATFYNRPYGPNIAMNDVNKLFPQMTINNYQTPGALGLGLQYTLHEDYNLTSWFYQFYDYVNMLYLDTKYKIHFTSSVGMTFGLQGVTQSAQGSNIINQQVFLNGQPAGSPNGNAYGLLWAINTKYDDISVGFNQVFGGGGSGQYLNGGLITPYTFSFEFDPLYTTTALTSLAEQGVGNAFLLQNKLKLLDDSLSFILRYGSYNTQVVIPVQSGYIQEWDAVLGYTVPNTKLFIQGRMVYLQESELSGGNALQTRFIMSYTY